MLRRFLVMVGGGLLCWGCNADTFTGDDGAAPDATNDVTGPTEGGGLDGGKGEGGVSDGGCMGPMFCKGDAGAGATICSDFDNVTDPATGWSAGVFATNGYTVTLSNEQFRSCPKSLLVTVPAASADGGANPGQGFLGANVPYNTSHHWVIDFDIRVPTVTSGDFFVFAIQAVGLANPFIGPVYRNGSFRLQVGSSPSSTFNLPPDTWAHMTLDLTLTNSTYAATLTIDGSKVAGPTTDTAATPGPTFLVNAGVQTTTTSITGAAPGNYFYDNIVVQLL